MNGKQEEGVKGGHIPHNRFEYFNHVSKAVRWIRKRMKVSLKDKGTGKNKLGLLLIVFL